MTVRQFNTPNRLFRLACPIMLFAVLPAPAQEALGRLFHSPEHRRFLDHLRDQGGQRPGARRDALPLSIDGIVIRSSGPKTLWINGNAIPDGKNTEGISITGLRGDPTRFAVKSWGSEATTARIGDAIDPGSGTIFPLLGKAVERSWPGPQK